MNTKKNYYGLLKRKECLCLTLRAWFLIFFAIIGLTILFFIRIHPFLAPEKVLTSKIMIVEGWLPQYALERVYKDYKKYNYQLIITTGGSVVLGSKDKYSFAMDCAQKLNRRGVPTEDIVVVSAPDVARDRTYSSALSVWEWVKNTYPENKTLNLYSMGAHGRRSWLLYKMAFPRDIKIGIISIENNLYDPEAWWETSNGVKSIIEELVTYLYARFLFRPIPLQ